MTGRPAGEKRMRVRVLFWKLFIIARKRKSLRLLIAIPPVIMLTVQNWRVIQRATRRALWRQDRELERLDRLRHPERFRVR